MVGWQTEEDKQRWKNILEIFAKQQKLKGFGDQTHWMEVIDKMGDYKSIFEELVHFLKSKDN